MTGEACEKRAGSDGNDGVVPEDDRATARVEHAGGREVVLAVVRATAHKKTRVVAKKSTKISRKYTR